MSIKQTLANWLLNQLFLPEPLFMMTPQMEQAFDDLISDITTNPVMQEINYTLPYPKHQFLTYLVQKDAVLLHGSNNPAIAELTPKIQTDWNGNQLNAVFATIDSIWPFFFATVQHKGYRGSFRNGCFVIGKSDDPEKRYYFFSLNKEYKDLHPWQEGMIYILPKGTFSPLAEGLIRFDEWASRSTVKPIAKMRVSPADFPFLANVSWHNEKENMVLTWLKYKHRRKSG